MAIFRASELSHLQLGAAADGTDMHYQVHDRRSGRIFRVDSDIARALHSVQATGRPASEELAKRLYGFMSGNRRMLEVENARSKPFNPLFAMVPLIDLSRWQPRLMGAARGLVGPQFWIAFTALLCIAIGVASASNWAILGEFGQIFSIAALASFALIAPILKLLHEMGHLLVATRYGVPVRKGGLMFVGLYPMPFVDCSMADLTANRRQRINISLAGLFVDLTVALVALIAWHFAPGGFGKTLLANIFFFSSLNSVLFNGNPLIKLDGYYALSDALGQRNLATRAQARFKKTTRWITHLGADGALPRGRGEGALAGFGFLSMLYRVNILLTIAWIMLPRFFGLGIVLVLWAGYAMFVSPLLSDAAPDTARTARKGGLRRLVFWVGLGGALAAALLLIRVPFIVVMPLQLDRAGSYEVRFVDTSGGGAILTDLAPDGPFEGGDLIFAVENLLFAQDQVLLEAEQRLLTTARDAALGVTPEEVLAAEERLRLVEARLTDFERRAAEQVQSAPQAGLFVAADGLALGEGLQEGQTVGAFFPSIGPSVVQGRFPERYVDLFESETVDISLRVAGEVRQDLGLRDITLIQQVAQDVETGRQTYSIRATLAQAPAELVGTPIEARVRIGRARLLDHLQLWMRDLQERYWDVRLANSR